MNALDNPLNITCQIQMDVPFKSKIEMMFGLICAGANFGFNYQPDKRIWSNIGIIYNAQFEIRTPIGLVNICLSENTPQPSRVLESPFGLFTLPPSCLHDNQGVPIHLIYISCPLDVIYASICDLVWAISPQATVLGLTEIEENSERYFKCLAGYKTG